jgi:formylglycine-generating enzyme required for sulfatase activity
MGSPLWEPDRIPINERPHRRVIPRSYAIMTKPVTVAQWQRFLKDRPDVPRDFLKRYSPEPGGPIIMVSWYMAAQYCNWLSAKEGIPRAQWCYPDEIKEGMRPFPDYLRRSGYRLPSEAEWEYAARAESASCWKSRLSLRERPSFRGAKGDNDCCARPYPRAACGKSSGMIWRIYWTGLAAPADNDQLWQRLLARAASARGRLPNSRALRGASFGISAPGVRSAVRSYNGPAIRNLIVGVRLCRTYH